VQPTTYTIFSSPAKYQIVCYLIFKSSQRKKRTSPFVNYECNHVRYIRNALIVSLPRLLTSLRWSTTATPRTSTKLIYSSIPTFLFPVFASYKALKTSDPALLTPWLMYWVVLAIALFAESWVGFILVWLADAVMRNALDIRVKLTNATIGYRSTPGFDLASSSI
jgi:hypothetical protein